MTRLSLVLSVLCFAGACGGGDGSGLPDNKSAGTLTMAEVRSLCEELAADFPPRQIDCGGGNTLEIGVDPAECATATLPATCTATVGDFRDCFAAMDALTDQEACMLSAPPAACNPVFSQECSGD